MASYAQLAMAAQAAEDKRKIEAAQTDELARREKAGKWGGLGRTLGLLGMGLATGGMGLLGSSVLTGLGGLGGRALGRSLGGGKESDAEKNVGGIFYKGARKDFRKNISDYHKGMNERMLVDTGKDMFSAYTFNKYMKPKLADMKTKWTGKYGTDAEKLSLMDPSGSIDKARDSADLFKFNDNYTNQKFKHMLRNPAQGPSPLVSNNATLSSGPPSVRPVVDTNVNDLLQATTASSTAVNNNRNALDLMDSSSGVGMSNNQFIGPAYPQLNPNLQSTNFYNNQNYSNNLWRRPG